MAAELRAAHIIDGHHIIVLIGQAAVGVVEVEAVTGSGTVRAAVSGNHVVVWPLDTANQAKVELQVVASQIKQASEPVLVAHVWRCGDLVERPQGLTLAFQALLNLLPDPGLEHCIDELAEGGD